MGTAWRAILLDVHWSGGALVPKKNNNNYTVWKAKFDKK